MFSCELSQASALSSRVLSSFLALYNIGFDSIFFPHSQFHEGMHRTPESGTLVGARECW